MLTADEIVDDEEDEILDSVVDSYVEGDRDAETDEEEVEVQPVRQQEAMAAVRLLQSYEEQQEDGDSELLRQLSRIETAIKRRIISSQQQAQITRYFT